MINTTINNIPVISWRSVILVEETGVLGEDQQPAASDWQTLSHNVVSSTPRHEWDSNSQPMGTDCRDSNKSDYNTIMMAKVTKYEGSNLTKYRHHSARNYIVRLQIPSSLCPTLHYEVTNTVIIVSDITLWGYKYRHHCVRHYIMRLQIPSSLCPTIHYEVINTDRKQPHIFC